MDELIRLRQELHRNPELSGNERATGKRIRFFLNRYKPDELLTGLAGEGMAAVYNGVAEGPTLLFRCDLDALPIHELGHKPYGSVVAGVSHACGHDGHMAIVSGLAQRLTENPVNRGRVILFYQPEEENGQGAFKAIQRLKEIDLIPDYAFAIHNMPKYPMGSIVMANNTFSSASKGLVIRLIGRESHAATPEKGLNPSMAVAEIIKGLNSLPSSKKFSNYVLVTIIHIRVGEVAFGTSPGYGEIMVTLRAFADEDMNILAQSAIEFSRSVGTAHGLAVETSITDDFPAAVCDDNLIELTTKIAKRQNRNVFRINEPNRWAEDFAHFTMLTPSIIFGLGVGEDVSDLHSPDYDFPDEAIQHGVDMFDEIITHFLREK
jgi:amidohydrolase